ncbi:uncharacterized protein LOC122009264 [Zingiber officinale]|uniref:uncharacterized protein LOC122009264 n=1 Tax=Zingiber officinale TaxID=94328 RepID=UPI001C4AA3D6|nr:uncharacterized protein LOC122009264 [Zingiber officinale]
MGLNFNIRPFQIAMLVVETNLYSLTFLVYFNVDSTNASVVRTPGPWRQGRPQPFHSHIICRVLLLRHDDASGLLEVRLYGPCYSYCEDGLTSFNSEARGNLSYGALCGVVGWAQEELFLWLPRLWRDPLRHWGRAQAPRRLRLRCAAGMPPESGRSGCRNR